MSLFGWSLPPGCSSLPGEDCDETCMLCGKDAGECECPECPECGVQGDLRCYENGHMQMTEEQSARKAAVEKAWEEENRKTYEAEQAWLNSKESMYMDMPDPPKEIHLKSAVICKFVPCTTHKPDRYSVKVGSYPAQMYSIPLEEIPHPSIAQYLAEKAIADKGLKWELHAGTYLDDERFIFIVK